MTELSKAALAWLDDEYMRYSRINHDIAVRKLEIEHPWKPHDDNIGGGRSSVITRPQESLVLKYDQDKVINRLIQLQNEVDAAREHMDGEQLKIFEMRYAGTNYYDWNTIGQNMHYAHSAIYRKRYRLLELLAQEKGII
ncbi:hypothetical protein [Loigolactobacillus backii]|uniref:hypothetical protein n=1 Tax=Loigolactobacillus backii TaxID=375175 RepID=UPI0022FD8976|nr:hypothetical protein [Loigolactobacillus backii]MDA5386966.1 hypothetical protein [Loigolactobacillus backii]MDA5389504.1 hypothetical protein [Loigolactobacillus backii]